MKGEPDTAAALEQAAVFHRTGQLAAAAAGYRSVLALDPLNADALHLLGVIASQQAEHGTALELIGRAIEQHGGVPAFHVSLAQVLARLDRTAEAEQRYREALRIAPGFADAHFKLGNLLRASARLAEAESEYRAALACDPQLEQARVNLGNLLRERGEFAAAAACYREALAGRPDYVEARVNLGVVLRAQGDPAAAIEEYRAALALRPDLAQAHCNLANALQALHRLPEAIEAYRAAVRLDPDYAEAHLNLALALLLTGRFEEGWREYEWRWRCEPALRANTLRRDFPQPSWDGTNAGGATLLLQAEQGFGDAIQFARLVPLVRQHAGSVILECQSELVRLLAASLPGVRIIARGETLPPFDVHCPLLSVPRVLNLDAPDLAAPVPYLRTDNAATNAWRARLAKEEAALRVGIAWAGEPGHSNDRNRSLSLAALAPLASAPKVVFYSLQKGPAAAQGAAPPSGMLLHDCTSELHDFADTAALIANLDLVITADTAVAHLAGALGKPTWVLLPFVPDWRWQLAREDSLWYPTVRLLRQQHRGEWTQPLLAAARELVAAAGGGGPAAGPLREFIAQSLARAVERYRAGDLGSAEAVAWQAVARAPANADFLGMLAAIRSAMRDFPSGEQWARQALRHAPRSPQLHVSLGYILRSQGRFEEALEAHRLAVAIAPDFTEGWHRLAQALRSDKRPQEALAALDRARAADPRYTPAWVTAGHTLQELGRTEDAIAAYEEAVRLDPRNAEAHVGLGTALHNAGRSAAAVDAHEAALLLRPDFPEAHNNLGNALRALERDDDALRHYEAAIRIRPGYHEALLNRGLVLQAVRRTDDAIASLEAAVAARPGSAQGHMALGTAYQDGSDYAAAEQCYREALRIAPDYAEAISNLGVTLQELGRLEEALDCHERALQLKPGDPDVLVNMGVTLKELGRLDEAIQCYQKALAARPGFEGGLINLGAALNEQGRLPEALDTYHRAVAENPASAEAHWNNSLALLLKGDFEQGWREYEWRWQSETARRARASKPAFAAPEWRGEPLPAGARLLLHAEQGYGDAIQFARYAPLLARRGLQVVIQCHKELVRTLSTLEGVEQVIPFGAPPPACDAWCPLLSLALALGTRVASIPAAVPYLLAERDKVEHWRSLLARDTARLRVGLVWAGRAEHRNDRNRSLGLAALAPLARVPGVRFYSLQKGLPAAQAAQPPIGMPFTDLSGELTDFADTAALLTQLDLLVTVDTAVLHLAAALARPVWALIPFAPDWRWLLGRDDSPWYPTVRLFRQDRPRDWCPVIERVADQLQELVEQRPPATASPQPVPALADGIAAHRSGRIDEARAVYERILAGEPRHADALHLSGVVATQRGDDAEAEARIRKALEINPRAAEYWNSLGNVLRQLERTAEAEAAYREALRINDGYAEAHNNLGLLLKAGGKPAEALAAIDKALRLHPAYVEGHVNRGNTLQALGRFEEAVTAYQAALALRAGYPEALMNLGNALQRQGRLTEAVARTQEALARRPDYTDAHMNLGHALQSQGRLEDALSCYREALRLKPDYAEAHWNQALALLLSGNLRDGFREYEWRWQWKNFPSARRSFSAPRWRGEDPAGKVILLHAEQVYGDTIQFIRYAPLVAARGARVIVECQPELQRLFAGIPGIHRLLAQGTPLPACDFECPLLSLPLAFDHDLATIPHDVPYLMADPPAVAAWRQRLDPAACNVGLVWAGSPAHQNDRNRSLSLAQFEALGRVPGVTFHSLQKGPPARQAGTPPAGMTLQDATSELRDFADTAALVAALDLVICADTSVAHLAGALGKPVWVLIPFAPDWRWLLERADSPWYPTMRLFRQESWDDWDSVIERVAVALAGHVDAAVPVPAVDRVALLQKAARLHQAGDYGAAETLYRRILAREPDCADAAHLLGVALRQSRRFPEALASIRRALTARGDVAQYHASLGNVHKDMGNLADAVTSYREALRLKPDYAEAHFNLGTTLHHQRLTDEAEHHFRAAVRCNDAFAEAWYNLGNVLQDRAAFAEAGQCYERAIELRPRDPRARSNLGTVHILEGRPAAAIEAFESAIAVDPQSADAHWNLSLALLLTGDFARGWPEYEWRWRTADGARLERRFPQPKWNGQELRGKRMLLHAEQGLGDAIQFVRYARLLAQRGATVLVESRPETARLFRGAAGVSRVITAGEPLPEFDLHSPLLSLPLAFGTRADTIPGTTPYLVPDAALMLSWAERIGRRPDALKVGLVWAGRPEHPHDRWRSLTPALLDPLLSVPGVTWFSLQKRAAGSPAAPASVPRLTDYTAELTDFADTAALVANLDLVIAVDTSVAHLAGALGRPVWVLLNHAPDWRWLMEREDSAWYPTMRLFRQARPREWSDVIDRVAEALVQAIPERRFVP